MSDPKKAAEVPNLPTASNTEKTLAPAAKPRTRVIRVPLKQLVLKIENYSHRAKEAFDRAALQPLLDSIKTEGLRHPPEVYAAGDGTYVVVTGNRRVTSLVLLAKDGVAGFSMDMEVETVELLDTTELDRLAWSVADNEVRLNLTASERFDVVKKFGKAGMPDERGASALGLSVKQYRRDVALVRNEWMLALVYKGAIPATTAVDLLEVADKKKRVAELKRFLEDWVAEKELEIEAEGRKRELKAAQKLVRSKLTPELKRHWLEQLAGGKELDAEVQRTLKVDLNPKTLEVAVQGFKLNLQTDPVEEIGRVLGTLSQIAKDAAPILKTRLALEGAEGPQAKLLSAKDSPQYDEDFLKQAGLQDLIQPPQPGFVADTDSGQ
jgi:ParB-like chromosome segregation protein Spo0J